MFKHIVDINRDSINNAIINTPFISCRLFCDMFANNNVLQESYICIYKCVVCSNR